MNHTSVVNALKENAVVEQVIKLLSSASFNVGAKSILRLSPIAQNARYKALYAVKLNLTLSFILTTGVDTMAW